MRHQIVVVGRGDAHDQLVADLVRFGLDASSVPDVTAARDIAIKSPPDLLVIEAAADDPSLNAQLERLALAPDTAPVLVLAIAADSSSTAQQTLLRSGADGLVTTPYDPAELVQRVRNLLRRASNLRSLSPLTGLPGNRAIAEALRDRIAAGSRMAFVHIDIDDFKTFNDRFGFMRGDELILLCAESVRKAAGAVGGEDVFLGHIGGDDFVAILDADDIDVFCSTLIGLWDDAVVDCVDRAAADVESVAGSANHGHVPPPTLSIGVATNRHRSFLSEWEASAIAAEMKEYAKRTPGSCYRVDRRRR